MNFEQIYDEHKSLVFNLCLQYVQNSEDAREITQDVFVKIFGSLDKFQQKSSIGTWIYRITINTALDFIKAKKRKKRFTFITSIFHENNAISEPANFNHPGVALENKESLQVIFRLINELPDRQKTALILNKMEQKSQADIADIMQITVKAADSLIQRARAALLQKMKASEGK